MRTASNVPVMIPPWIAGLALVANGVQLWLVWSHRDLWAQSASWIPALTSTGVASSISLCTSLALVLCTTKLRWQDLGLTPRQLGAAAAVAASVWLSNQAIHLIDAHCAGPVPTATGNIVGAAMSACSEEFLFRFVVIGGATRLAVTRFQSSHPLRLAVVASSLLFAASHVPHDVVLGVHPGFRALTIVYGGLMALVWLTTGNLLMTAALHMLGNEPMLLVAGPHAHVITIGSKWITCGAVIAGFAWRRSRCGA